MYGGQNKIGVNATNIICGHCKTCMIICYNDTAFVYAHKIIPINEDR